ncbi:Transcriptional regulatory protein PmpR [invertebrate metagenome]|uniref:Transcriptional regulatory protein PmpR n=1 Tax=invertebrate metagenome TaxID=1711999 RepID=A0A2H9TAV9_9ZZZZ
MTRNSINRAITRGAGTGDGADMDEITYEGYGPGGIAVLVECLTDNKNRTVAEVRHAFSKHGGNMGTSGSVAYLFEKKGQMYFEPGADEDAIMEAALESGADDVVTNDDGSIEVMTDWTELTTVKESLESAGQKPMEAEVAMIPSTHTELDKEGAEKILRLIDRLESLDDVQDVYTNADISDEIMDQIQEI